jgi:hypothetical protein
MRPGGSGGNGRGERRRTESQRDKRPATLRKLNHTSSFVDTPNFPPARDADIRTPRKKSGYGESMIRCGSAKTICGSFREDLTAKRKQRRRIAAAYINCDFAGVAQSFFDRGCRRFA